MLTYTKLQEIRHSHRFDDYDIDIDEYKKMLDDALEKQVPKKPIEQCSGAVTVCPICKDIVVKGMKYCDECGQAIDWSDSND